MNENTQKYLSFLVVVIVIIGGFLLLKNKVPKVEDTILNTEVKDDVVNPIDTTVPIKPIVDNTSGLTGAQKALLIQLQKTVDARDFESFANVLLEVYKKKWNGVKEFMALESKLYVYATNEYWVKGDLENSLRVSTIVYNKVPEGWRFRYLRILTLHKYGRNAFESGDLTTAENYANQILQMMYRPEGANLLADVYISKIETNMKDGNIDTAKQNLEFIWDFEVNQGRRDILIDLKRQLGE